jgi:hypothetical protein
MSILLQAVDVRHEHRIRLVFTNALASGAFGLPAPTNYVIANTDGLGTSPSVKAAYVVPGNPAVVELALSAPIVAGAAYTISAVGVPAVDTTVTPVGSVLSFRYGATVAKENVEPIRRDRELLLYGIDLLWNGADFQETANGDLDRVSGAANVTKALNRGVEANGLGWDSTYGAKAREFIDSPSVAVGTLKGSVTAQLLRDPRVQEVRVTYDIQDSKTFLFATPKLISGESIEPVSIVVPNA